MCTFFTRKPPKLAVSGRFASFGGPRYSPGLAEPIPDYANIRVYTQKSTGVVYRELTSLQLVFCASPNYFNRNQACLSKLSNCAFPFLMFAEPAQIAQQPTALQLYSHTVSSQQLVPFLDLGVVASPTPLRMSFPYTPEQA